METPALLGVLACTAVLSGSLARADETPADRVVVTSTRSVKPAGVRIITRQEIERSGATTLSELLRSSQGLRTRELPGSPNPQLDLRGSGLFGEHNALVLLDGMRVREYELLTVNWSAIPLSSVERIEVLPPGSVIHGGGGSAGAINIVTRAPAAGSRSADLAAKFATHATREWRAGGAMAGDRLGARVDGSRYETDNYRDNSRVRIDNTQANLRWSGETGALDIKAGADEQRTGLPGVISEAQLGANRRQAARRFDFATQRGSYLNLGASAGDLKVRLGYRERDASLRFLVGTPLSNTVVTQLSMWAIGASYRFAPGIGDLIVGADAEDWKFEGTAGPAFVSRPHSTQRTAGAFAQYNAALASRTTLGIGARLQQAQYGTTDLANPAATGKFKRTLQAWDMSVQQSLSPALSVYGRHGANFRLPNVNDNFNPVLARVTLLEPQKALDSEIGLQGNGGGMRYRMALYRSDLRGELFFDPVTGGSRNRPPTRRRGLALEGRWTVGRSLALYGDVIFARATFRDGSVAGRPIAGNPVPISPRHTLNAGMEWRFSETMRADFAVHHTGSSAFDGDEARTFGRRIPAYTVADISLSLRSGGWLLNAGVRNLFGEKYLSYGVVTGRPSYSAVPAAERTLFTSAQYSFD